MQGPNVGEDAWRTLAAARPSSRSALQQGDSAAALEEFSRLLQRIEALPPDHPLGPGSYEHCLTLRRLWRCFEARLEFAGAEHCYRKGLKHIEALIKQEPDEKGYAHQRGALLMDLGDTLLGQGNYPEARTSYEASLEVKHQLGDRREEAVALGQLGALALEQRDYPEAKTRYETAHEVFMSLGEPAQEAICCYQLGLVLIKQEQWDEAERNLKDSLRLRETISNALGAAYTCDALGNLASLTGRAFPILAQATTQVDLRPELEHRMARIESGGGKITTPIHRIWAGERDWHTLSEDLDREEALFALRVLEILKDPRDTARGLLSPTGARPCRARA